MKKLYTYFTVCFMVFGIAALLTGPLQAQNVQVTFRVDMANVDEISPLGVHIAGNFQGWNPGSTEMTEPPFGTVFSYTQEFTPGSQLEYKFINGNDWGMDEFVPAGCAQNNNRFLTVPDEDVILDVVCFGSCTVCNPAQVEITFQVDMSNETISPNGVHIAGSFQDWNPSGTPMTHIGDDIYEAVFTLGEGEYHEYKFINGNAWGSDESVPPSCASGFNRYITVPGVSTTLDAVCFGSCDPCGPPPVDVEVTFRVDMSQEEISPAGVHIGGAFQGWDPGSTPMVDEGGGIYSYTAIFSSGSYEEYKFVNGTTWEESENLPEECNNNNNRFFTVPQTDTIFDIVCYGLCGPCPTPAEVEVTFQVDMSEQTIAPEGVHVAGTFNGFSTSETPLTDTGDGIWAVTLTLTEGDYIMYKFVNGDTFQGFETVPPECSQEDGNRELTVPADSTSLDVVCFGSCDPCVPPPTVDVVFYVDMSNEVVSPDGVHVAGSFNGFSTTETPMTDADLDDIYEATVTLVVGDHVTYKFINGNTFDGEETVPPACGEPDGFGGYNRYFDVTDPANILDPVCFGSCEECVVPVEVEVTFRVDMQNEVVSPNGVHIAGTFNGWNTGSDPMSLLQDQIYTYTTTLIAGDNHEYKFLNGNLTADYEEISGDCTTQEGNRFITIPENDTIIEVVCFGLCEACPVPAEVEVTFRVDMSLETIAPEGVHIAGTFNNFSTGETPLTDMGDGIWAVTLTLTEGDYIMYKFINGDTFQGFETVPPECSQEDGNRELTVPGESLTLDAVCFGSCDPCVPPPTVNVTFQVDMSLEDVSGDEVHLAGSFQGWDPTATPMTDMGSGVWEITLPLEIGVHHNYKFINGISFDFAEIVPEACGEDDGTGVYNRYLDVPDNDTTLNLVCFGGCDVCPAEVDVTFQVDMSNEVVSPDGVHVAGSFNGFDPTATPLTDQGNGVYAVTLTLLEGDHVNYKYINGTSFDFAESVPPQCGEPDGFGGYNRYIDVPETAYIIPLHCFGSCTECVPPVDVDVTFRVDMSNEVVSQDGVHIAGSFNGFDPAATPLTEQGDGVYAVTIALTAGDHVTYKYINGNSFDFAETVPAECGEDDGFGGFNRYIDVPETAYTVPLHCFSSCEPCVALTHEIALFEGWNSLSSYIMPTNNDIEAVTEEITAQLVIMQTMTEVYFPDGGLNTIETWDSQSAYKIKVTEDVILNISGTPEQNKTVLLQEGWNLIPVVSDVPVNAEDLFGDVIDKIIVVKGVAETGILWPDYDINTLINLLPGKAYYVKTTEPVEITYP